MRFLLTNDDGYDAPGLAALAKAAARLGEVVVVAPHEHVSGCGHRVTTDRPLRLTELQPRWFMLDGLPADCSRIGIAQLAGALGERFDWVISGVNSGGNLGADIFHSGTVAAAREACLLGTPSIAISQYRRSPQIDWPTVATWTEAVLRWAIERPPAAVQIWNINLPHLQDDNACPEIVACRVDPNPLPVSFEVEAGQFHYRGRYSDRRFDVGTDVDVCFGGRIAASLVQLF